MFNIKTASRAVFLLFACWILLPSYILAQQVEDKRVLFVGNSYTYFWNLSQTVEALSDNTGYEMTTRQSTAGGVNFGQHLRHEKGLTTTDKIKNGDYDIVILQEFSRGAVDDPEDFHRHGLLLDSIIDASGAQTYLYMTWARAWDPYMMKTIEMEYSKLARKADAKLVPVGMAWKRALELRPSLPLYDADGSHPSPLGTYLTACVFYGVINSSSPVGLPQRVIAKDVYGDRLYLNIQTKEDALFCQKVADEIIEKYHPNYDH